MLLPTADPALAHIASAALAIVLLVGAAQKLADRDGFTAALEQYRLLPGALSAAAAWLLMATELAAGALLLLPLLRPLAGWLALALLGVVTAAVAVNLLRGRAHIDCGCGGAQGRQHLSWWLVVRNALLMALALLATQPQDGARELVWLDGLTVATGAVGLYLLYAAANQLLANAPRLMQFRE
jgi:uncharacterized membrane protein YphA (DoxX/SURF4 family)